MSALAAKMKTEEKTVRKVVAAALKRQARPSEIKGFNVVFGEDSTGDASVWVWLLVPDDLHPQRDRVTELRKFADLVRDKLIDAKLTHWPYVQYTANAENALK